MSYFQDLVSAALNAYGPDSALDLYLAVEPIEKKIAQHRKTIEALEHEIYELFTGSQVQDLTAARSTLISEIQRKTSSFKAHRESEEVSDLEDRIAELKNYSFWCAGANASDQLTAIKRRQKAIARFQWELDTTYDFAAKMTAIAVVAGSEDIAPEWFDAGSVEEFFEEHPDFLSDPSLHESIDLGLGEWASYLETTLGDDCSKSAIKVLRNLEDNRSNAADVHVDVIRDQFCRDLADHRGDSEETLEEMLDSWSRTIGY